LNNCPVKKIFVDGGFGKNNIYMNLLAAAFRQMDVYASSVAQASAIGAALAVHDAWNKHSSGVNTIELAKYKPSLTFE
jgi:L-fuculokinase